MTAPAPHSQPRARSVRRFALGAFAACVTVAGIVYCLFYWPTFFLGGVPQ
jgi:hypothetical protein